MSTSSSFQPVATSDNQGYIQTSGTLSSLAFSSMTSLNESIYREESPSLSSQQNTESLVGSTQNSQAVAAVRNFWKEGSIEQIRAEQLDLMRNLIPQILEFFPNIAREDLEVLIDGRILSCTNLKEVRNCLLTFQRRLIGLLYKSDSGWRLPFKMPMHLKNFYRLYSCYNNLTTELAKASSQGNRSEPTIDWERALSSYLNEGDPTLALKLKKELSTSTRNGPISKQQHEMIIAINFICAHYLFDCQDLHIPSARLLDEAVSTALTSIVAGKSPGFGAIQMLSLWQLEKGGVAAVVKNIQSIKDPEKRKLAMETIVKELLSTDRSDKAFEAISMIDTSTTPNKYDLVFAYLSGYNSPHPLLFFDWGFFMRGPSCQNLEKAMKLASKLTGECRNRALTIIAGTALDETRYVFQDLENYSSPSSKGASYREQFWEKRILQIMKAVEAAVKITSKEKSEILINCVVELFGLKAYEEGNKVVNLIENKEIKVALAKAHRAIQEVSEDKIDQAFKSAHSIAPTIGSLSFIRNKVFGILALRLAEVGQEDQSRQMRYEAGISDEVLYHFHFQQEWIVKQIEKIAMKKPIAELTCAWVQRELPESPYEDIASETARKLYALIAEEHPDAGERDKAAGMIYNSSNRS